MSYDPSMAHFVLNPDQAVSFIQKASKRDVFGFFQDPVAPEDAPDYYEIVKKPMDFSTMLKKARNGVYITLGDLVADLKLIRDNCLLYNDPSTKYAAEANKLWDWIEKALFTFYKRFTAPPRRGRPVLEPGHPGRPRRGRPPLTSRLDHRASVSLDHSSSEESSLPILAHAPPPIPVPSIASYMKPRARARVLPMDYPSEDESRACEICDGGADTLTPLLFCANIQCNTCVHAHCYFRSLPDAYNAKFQNISSPFYCDSCLWGVSKHSLVCSICTMSTGGVLRPSARGLDPVYKQENGITEQFREGEKPPQEIPLASPKGALPLVRHQPMPYAPPSEWCHVICVYLAPNVSFRKYAPVALPPFDSSASNAHTTTVTPDVSSSTARASTPPPPASPTPTVTPDITLSSATSTSGSTPLQWDGVCVTHVDSLLGMLDSRMETRKRVVCRVCRGDSGCTVHCGKASCPITVHPSCAAMERWEIGYFPREAATSFASFLREPLLIDSLVSYVPNTATMHKFIVHCARHEVYPPTDPSRLPLYERIAEYRASLRTVEQNQIALLESERQQIIRKVQNRQRHGEILDLLDNIILGCHPSIKGTENSEQTGHKVVMREQTAQDDRASTVAVEQREKQQGSNSIDTSLFRPVSLPSHGSTIPIAEEIVESQAYMQSSNLDSTFLKPHTPGTIMNDTWIRVNDIPVSRLQSVHQKSLRRFQALDKLFRIAVSAYAEKNPPEPVIFDPESDDDDVLDAPFRPQSQQVQVHGRQGKHAGIGAQSSDKSGKTFGNSWSHPSLRGMTGQKDLGLPDCSEITFESLQALAKEIQSVLDESGELRSDELPEFTPSSISEWEEQFQYSIAGEVQNYLAPEYAALTPTQILQSLWKAVLAPPSNQPIEVATPAVYPSPANSVATPATPATPATASALSQSLQHPIAQALHPETMLHRPRKRGRPRKVDVGRMDSDGERDYYPTAYSTAAQSSIPASGGAYSGPGASGAQFVPPVGMAIPLKSTEGLWQALECYFIPLPPYASAQALGAVLRRNVNRSLLQQAIQNGLATSAKLFNRRTHSTRLFDNPPPATALLPMYERDNCFSLTELATISLRKTVDFQIAIDNSMTTPAPTAVGPNAITAAVMSTLLQAMSSSENWACQWRSNPELDRGSSQNTGKSNTSNIGNSTSEIPPFDLYRLLSTLAMDPSLLHPSLLTDLSLVPPSILPSIHYDPIYKVDGYSVVVEKDRTISTSSIGPNDSNDKTNYESSGPNDTGRTDGIEKYKAYIPYLSTDATQKVRIAPPGAAQTMTVLSSSSTRTARSFEIRTVEVQTPVVQRDFDAGRPDKEWIAGDARYPVPSFLSSWESNCSGNATLIDFYGGQEQLEVNLTVGLLSRRGTSGLGRGQSQLLKLEGTAPAKTESGQLVTTAIALHASPPSISTSTPIPSPNTTVQANANIDPTLLNLSTEIPRIPTVPLEGHSTWARIRSESEQTPANIGLGGAEFQDQVGAIMVPATKVQRSTHKGLIVDASILFSGWGSGESFSEIRREISSMFNPSMVSFLQGVQEKGYCKDTIFRFATLEDVPALYYAQLLNQPVHTQADLANIIKRKNEFILLATRKVKKPSVGLQTLAAPEYEEHIVGYIVWYCLWFRPSNPVITTAAQAIDTARSAAKQMTARQQSIQFHPHNHQYSTPSFPNSPQSYHASHSGYLAASFASPSNFYSQDMLPGRVSEGDPNEYTGTHIITPRDGGLGLPPIIKDTSISQTNRIGSRHPTLASSDHISPYGPNIGSPSPTQSNTGTGGTNVLSAQANALLSRVMYVTTMGTLKREIHGPTFQSSSSNGRNGAKQSLDGTPNPFSEPYTGTILFLLAAQFAQFQGMSALLCESLRQNLGYFTEILQMQPLSCVHNSELHPLRLDLTTFDPWDYILESEARRLVRNSLGTGSSESALFSESTSDSLALTNVSGTVAALQKPVPRLPPLTGVQWELLYSLSLMKHLQLETDHRVVNLLQLVWRDHLIRQTNIAKHQRRLERVIWNVTGASAAARGREREEKEKHADDDGETSCGVCGGCESRLRDAILFCDKSNCNLPVHQLCYGIAHVPDGDWYCEPCSTGLYHPSDLTCVLCNIRGGPLRHLKTHNTSALSIKKEEEEELTRTRRKRREVDTGSDVSDAGVWIHPLCLRVLSRTGHLKSVSMTSKGEILGLDDLIIPDAYFSPSLADRQDQLIRANVASYVSSKAEASFAHQNPSVPLLQPVQLQPPHLLSVPDAPLNATVNSIIPSTVVPSLPPSVPSTPRNTPSAANPLSSLPVHSESSSPPPSNLDILQLRLHKHPFLPVPFPIPPSLQNLPITSPLCGVCGGSGGVCIPCEVPGCTAGVHALCAVECGLISLYPPSPQRLQALYAAQNMSKFSHPSATYTAKNLYLPAPPQSPARGAGSTVSLSSLSSAYYPRYLPPYPVDVSLPIHSDTLAAVLESGRLPPDVKDLSTGPSLAQFPSASCPVLHVYCPSHKIAVTGRTQSAHQTTYQAWYTERIEFAQEASAQEQVEQKRPTPKSTTKGSKKHKRKSTHYSSDSEGDDSFVVPSSSKGYLSSGTFGAKKSEFPRDSLDPYSKTALFPTSGSGSAFDSWFTSSDVYTIPAELRSCLNAVSPTWHEPSKGTTLYINTELECRNMARNWALTPPPPLPDFDLIKLHTSSIPELPPVESPPAPSLSTDITLVPTPTPVLPSSPTTATSPFSLFLATAEKQIRSPPLLNSALSLPPSTPSGSVSHEAVQTPARGPPPSFPSYPLPLSPCSTPLGPGGLYAFVPLLRILVLSGGFCVNIGNVNSLGTIAPPLHPPKYTRAVRKIGQMLEQDELHMNSPEVVALRLVFLGQKLCLNIDASRVLGETKTREIRTPHEINAYQRLWDTNVPMKVEPAPIKEDEDMRRLEDLTVAIARLQAIDVAKKRASAREKGYTIGGEFGAHQSALPRNYPLDLLPCFYKSYQMAVASGSFRPTLADLQKEAPPPSARPSAAAHPVRQAKLDATTAISAISAIQNDVSAAGYAAHAKDAIHVGNARPQRSARGLGSASTTAAPTASTTTSIATATPGAVPVPAAAQIAASSSAVGHTPSPAKGSRGGKQFGSAGGEGASSKQKDEIKSLLSVLPPEPRYCICGGWYEMLGLEGEMIGCDADHCLHSEWFHVTCIGYEKAPTVEDKWLCFGCRGLPWPDPIPPSIAPMNLRKMELKEREEEAKAKLVRKLSMSALGDAKAGEGVSTQPVANAISNVQAAAMNEETGDSLNTLLGKRQRQLSLDTQLPGPKERLFSSPLQTSTPIDLRSPEKPNDIIADLPPFGSADAEATEISNSGAMTTGKTIVHVTLGDTNTPSGSSPTNSGASDLLDISTNGGATDDEGKDATKSKSVLTGWEFLSGYGRQNNIQKK